MKKSGRWKNNRHRIRREKARLRKKVRRNMYAINKSNEASWLRKLAGILKLMKEDSKK